MPKLRKQAQRRRATLAVGCPRVVASLAGAWSALAVLALLAGVAWCALPAHAAADQASQPTSPPAGGLGLGALHSCALLDNGQVRCWGSNAEGELGYGNANTIGASQTPASVGPVNLGPGRTAKAISAGAYHTCAILDDASVRCWGYGRNGRLGYGNTNNVGDQQTPGSAGPVNLGTRHTAKAISAGGAHTCAILDDASVRCWGYGGQGQLGYGNTADVGDHKTPGSVGAVDLGGHTAKAISAGADHTCAILDDDSVRCWGLGQYGRLGYGNTDNIGDSRTPGSVGPVNLGLGRTAKAISAGGVHTCAVLDNASVRCWGYGGFGQLGYGNASNVGGQQTPDTAGPVMLGPGRSALAITAGQIHTCALLDNGAVRCWGFGNNGRLGYGNTNPVGDLQTPDTAGPVNLGPGHTAVAISAGESHTCARLDDGSVRCWGSGAYGRLGYCSQDDIGDDETPGSVGPVNLVLGDAGTACPPGSTGHPSTTSSTPPPIGAAQSPSVTKVTGITSDAARTRGLRTCLAGVVAHARRAKRRFGRGSARVHARAKRETLGYARSGRRRCLHLYGRTPGQVMGLRALTRGKTEVELLFNAPGTDGNRPPAAHTYVVKQSPRPIRGAHSFLRAQTLCKGKCRFRVTQTGAKITLIVTDLRPHTTYYYAIAALDNVSGQPGPRSRTVKARTP